MVLAMCWHDFPVRGHHLGHPFRLEACLCRFSSHAASQRCIKTNLVDTMYAVGMLPFRFMPWGPFNISFSTQVMAMVKNLLQLTVADVDVSKWAG